MENLVVNKFDEELNRIETIRRNKIIFAHNNIYEK